MGLEPGDSAVGFTLPNANEPIGGSEVSLSDIPVSYTHLTLPTIYSV